MGAKFLLLLVAAAAVHPNVVQSVPVGHGLPTPTATCACKMQYGGSNPCCCTELLVRPPSPVKPPRTCPRYVIGMLPPPQNFAPVHDLCCGDPIAVSPAVVPRPPCDLCATRFQDCHKFRTMCDEPPTVHRKCPCGLPNCDCCSCGTPGCAGCSGGSCNCGVSGCMPDCDCHCHMINECPHCAPPPPADPVSMSLAYSQQMKAQHHVREDALTFGFNQLPKDAPPCKKTHRVQEEKLANWHAPAVELMAAAPCGCQAALEEEARDALLRAEQMLLEESLTQSTSSLAKPSLADLGYRPAVSGGPRFVPETGCASSMSISLPASAPSYPMPRSYPEGRVMSVSRGDGDIGGRFGYRGYCGCGRYDCSGCGGDDEGDSQEVISSTSFVPVAHRGIGGGIEQPCLGEPYSTTMGVPPPSICGSQLFNRMQSVAMGNMNTFP